MEKHKNGRRHRNHLGRMEETQENALFKLDHRFTELEVMFPLQMAPCVKVFIIIHFKNNAIDNNFKMKTFCRACNTYVPSKH
jgi:hypothetical protein